MPTIRFDRPFSTGSRPTPDPYDHFLDSNGFYRKHTARDPSSLFRVVSEQLYDTQDHHQQVRKDCVNFMIKHRAQYEELITGDFDQYVQTMAKTETLGTLTELRAMGYLFKRNITLFRPKQLGNMLVDEADYRDQQPLRVFHNNLYFDSVFEKPYIIDAAFCQSLVYEMLYKKVFKLPDIEYSVETMLHCSDINEPSKYEYENGDDYPTHIVFEDGRKFELDRPENTHCILKDKDRCHFHNKNFEECLKQNPKRYEKSTLSDKFNSCVRQLFFDGITPFPYKVAKSLDQNIYRNVELDSWNDERKISKQKNYYKVGVECLVEVSKNDDNDELLKCQILAKLKDDTFVVYVAKDQSKRLVSFTHLRPLRAARSPSRDFAPMYNNRIGGGGIGQSPLYHLDYKLHGNTKLHTTKRQRIENFATDFPYNRDAIFNSDFDFEPYINLSNLTLSASHAQRELIAYPMVYSQSGNMNSNNSNQSNGGNSTGNSKSMKNRQPNNVQQQLHQTNDGEGKVTLLKNDTDNGNGNGNSNGGAGGQQYGRNGHELKNDSQLSNNSSSSNAGNQQSYHQQQQMAEPNLTVDVSNGMPTTMGHPQMSNYHQQGPIVTAPTPVYYYPTAGDEQNGLHYASSEMVVPHGVYAIPAAAAYQSAAATTAMPPNMQPGIYAPATQTTHYPIPVNGWPAYTQPMNPQGYVFSPAPHYAVPAIPTPMPMPLPFLSRELLRTNGRPNYNLNYSYQPGGEDLPLNEKVSVRFFYNLGIEYFKYLKETHGYGSVMAMIDGDNVGATNAYEQSPSVTSDVDAPSQHHLANDFQQFNLDTPDVESSSPSKHRSYSNNSTYHRYGSTKYKRNDNRTNSGAKHFQGTYQGPAKNFIKNTSKYSSQSGGTSNGNTNSYDSTPMKDNGSKVQHQHGGGHGMSKQQQQPHAQQSNDAEQAVIVNQFGSHVPPFPFHDQSDGPYQYHGPPPSNVYSRMTPPASSRPSSVPGNYYHNNHQVHGASSQTIGWLPTAPPGFHQSQMSSSHSAQPNQSHSLNTSSASNPSV